MDYKPGLHLFCLEASDDPLTNSPAHQRFFKIRQDALVDAEEALSRFKFKCVWASELGLYETVRGTCKENWVYFWWNKPAGEAYDWPYPPPGGLTGYPEGATGRQVDHTRLKKGF